VGIQKPNSTPMLVSWREAAPLKERLVVSSYQETLSKANEAWELLRLSQN
jgi:hypothetical protein